MAHHVASKLFRRHVRRRSEDGPGLGERSVDQSGAIAHRHRVFFGVGAQSPGKAEICDSRAAIASDQNIGRLEVSVHDALFVGRDEPTARLQEDIENLTSRPGPLEPLGEGATVDEFHRDEDFALMVADVEDGHDVRMLQQRVGLGFSAQPRGQNLGSGQRRTAQHFDRNVALQLSIQRPIHAPAASGADQLEQLVPTYQRGRQIVRSAAVRGRMGAGQCIFVALITGVAHGPRTLAENGDFGYRPLLPSPVRWRVGARGEIGFTPSSRRSMESPTKTLSVVDDGTTKDEHEARPLLCFVLCSDQLDLPPRRMVLSRSSTTFGRAAQFELAAESDGQRAGIPDPRMSNRHARIFVDRGTFRVEDLGSKNGSLVNGEVLRTSMPLRDGDVVELGHSFFVFRDRTSTWPGDDDRPQTLGRTDVATLFGPLAIAFDALERVADAEIPIAIRGETGVGKEVVARAIHALSRREGSLVPVNCGALPEALVESELFGSAKGAFSGAVSDRAGLIRAADRGTLFLDEVGELPLVAQAKLLRVLQDGAVWPVGAAQSTPVDFRLLSATHRDLRDAVKGTSFRGDLFARLSGFEFEIPPLRRRIEDLGLLLRHFVVAGGGTLESVSLGRLLARRLLLHQWPYNVRELERAVSVGLALAEGGFIGPEQMPLAEEQSRPSEAPRHLSPEDQARREQLIALLVEHKGNISEVARSTGKARMQIHRWLKRYAIEPQRLKRPDGAKS